jgi:hypothetical protein
MEGMIQKLPRCHVKLPRSAPFIVYWFVGSVYSSFRPSFVRKYDDWYD